MKDGWLGIDVGSVSVKLAIVDKDENLVNSVYLRNNGLVSTVQEGLEKIANDYEIKGVGVTGSGRNFVGLLTGADLIKTEILAHAVGTLKYYPDVRTLFDIGGEDSKLLTFSDGILEDFRMNSICFTENTQITIQDFTSKSIKEIEEGEEVLTHKGRFKKVKKKFVRNYNGEILKISIGKKVLELTPEHPILVLKREKIICYQNHSRGGRISICKPKKDRNTSWCGNCKKGINFSFEPKFIQAKNLEKGDFVVTPFPLEINNLNNIEHNGFKIKNKKITFGKSKINDDTVKKIVNLWNIGYPIYKIAKKLKLSSPTITKYLNQRIERNKFEGRSRTTVNGIKITKEFLRILGYYLSEGNIMYNYNKKDKKIKYPSGVQFTFHINEDNYVNRITRFMTKEFPNISIKVTKKPERKTMIVSICNKDFAKIIFSLCGESSKNKKISKELMFLEPNLQKEIVKGFFEGDGHLCRRNKNRNNYTKSGNRYVATTISKNLANQLYWIILRNKIKCKFFKHNNKTKAGNDIYSVGVYGNDIDKLMDEKLANLSIRSSFKSFTYKNFLFEPIQKITKNQFNGNVYNLEVEEDNSYIANLIAVHNCSAGTGSFLESIAGKMGVKIEDVGDIALNSGQRLDFPSKCGVFTQSAVVSKKNSGANKEDILMGVCRSLVSNYLTMAKGNNLQPPFVYQGATAKNIAIVKAFEEQLGHEVTVPKYCDVIGSIGMGILTRRENPGKTNFKGYELSNDNYKTLTRIADGCENHCELTELFKDDKYVGCIGNKCPRCDSKK